MILKLALLFLALALISGALGFGGASSASASASKGLFSMYIIGKILFVLFIILLIGSLIF